MDQFKYHSKQVLLSEAVEIYLFLSTLADNSQLEYGGKEVRSFYRRHFFFLIGTQLLYNAVSISFVQQSESAIYIHVDPPS